MVSPSEFLSFAVVAIGVGTGGALGLLVSAALSIAVGRRTPHPRLVVRATRWGALLGVFPSLFYGLYVGSAAGAGAMGPEWSVLGAAIGWGICQLFGMLVTSVAAMLLALPVAFLRRGGDAV